MRSFDCFASSSQHGHLIMSVVRCLAIFHPLGAFDAAVVGADDRLPNTHGDASLARRRASSVEGGANAARVSCGDVA
jgi:hypothetical protein